LIGKKEAPNWGDDILARENHAKVKLQYLDRRRHAGPPRAIGDNPRLLAERSRRLPGRALSRKVYNA